MKKKLLVILFSCMCILSFSGCTTTTPINVNVENSNELNNTKIGISSLIKICDGLLYDSTTRIVYWWNGSLLYSNNFSVPSAYYAPNGFPYRYNPETNTFEEINT